MGQPLGAMAGRRQQPWYEEDGDDDLPVARGPSVSTKLTDDSPKGASARASRRSRSPNVHRGTAPRLPQEPTHTRIPEESTSEFLHSLRKTGSGQLEDIMTTLEVYKMKL